jgi:NAD(P)-dependent dehydrogenase (short-subunit alcohol dehydrogenase family)
MGRAAAIAFAREGADVAINHLPEEMEDAREVVELMKAEGRKALSIPGDIRDESFCKRLVAEAVQGLGGLDILVSNAGRQQTRASILDLSTEDFDATMKTNIYAPFWIIKSALPHMPPGSAIIGTASEQAYDPSRPLRLCSDKGRHDELCEVSGEATRSEGYSRERCGARADLDSATNQRRRHSGEGGKVRWPNTPRSTWPTRGAWVHLRAIGNGGREFCPGPSLWVGRRKRTALIAGN